MISECVYFCIRVVAIGSETGLCGDEAHRLAAPGLRADHARKRKAARAASSTGYVTARAAQRAAHR